jgi:hypothetical protein
MSGVDPLRDWPFFSMRFIFLGHLILILQFVAHVIGGLDFGNINQIFTLLL